MLLKRDKIGELDNEAVTLTDIADGPPDIGASQFRTVPPRQSGLDPNEVEMHHCSVGQSTGFGGREDLELHTGSKFNFMENVGIITG